MIMIKKYFFLAIFAVLLDQVCAQNQPVYFNMQMLAAYNGPSRVPFWIQSNQFGSIPPKGASLGLIGSIRKDYNRNQKLDWAFSAEGRLNVGDPAKFLLIEGYGKIKLGIFELKAGRSRDIMGLCDTALSSGSFSVSGNAPGVPGIVLSIPDFYTLPLLGRMFAFKGSYGHGWMGNWYYGDEKIPDTQTYLHQKSLYGRFGKANWRLKLYGGFNHQVTWGNEKKILGDSYNLTPFQSFVYVNIGKGFIHDTIQRTRVGNHLGSIDLGFTYAFKNVDVFVYRQNFYDASALYFLANLMDGLNGLSFVNKSIKNRQIQWKRFLIELLYTKNQGGETWSRQTTTPFEDYYNNAYYKSGWSYKGPTLGNPFITPSVYQRNGLPSAPPYYFSNNRVIAFHTGLEFDFFKWYMLGKFSYSKNYGLYLTSTSGKIFNGENVEALNGIFPITRQISTYFEARRNLKNNFEIRFITAFDIGGLYDDAFGFAVGISRSF
jgi:hypothetical protein